MVKDKEDIKEAMDKLEVLSKDQHLRRIAELREKAIRDEISALAYATERGHERGLKEGEKIGEERGLEKGRTEGRNEGQKLKEIEIAKNMLKEGLEISLIEKVTGLTVEEIEKIKTS